MPRCIKVQSLERGMFVVAAHLPPPAAIFALPCFFNESLLTHSVPCAALLILSSPCSSCVMLCLTRNVSVELWQTFVGLTALLAAFPPCLGTGLPSDDQPTQPVLSGSVCSVRDSVDFLDVSTLLIRTHVLLLLLCSATCTELTEPRVA